MLVDSKLGLVEDVSKPLLMLFFEIFRAVNFSPVFLDEFDTYKLGDFLMSWKLFFRK